MHESLIIQKLDSIEKKLDAVHIAVNGDNDHTGLVRKVDKLMGQTERHRGQFKTIHVVLFSIFQSASLALFEAWAPTRSTTTQTSAQTSAMETPLAKAIIQTETH